MKHRLPFIFLLLGVFYAPVIRDARGDVLAEVVNAVPICAVSRSTVYDPDLGRWTSRDPIGETGGQNLYEYAANDPVDNVDPTGLCPQPGGIFGNGQYRDEDGNVRDENGDLIKDQLDPLNPINFEGGNSPLNFTPEDAAMGAAETTAPTLGSLTPSQGRLIQAFSDRFGVEVNVVGSRAAGSGLTSDFDYVIGGNSSLRNSAEYYLPRGPLGTGANGTGVDVFNANLTPLDTTRPYIQFTPGNPPVVGPNP